MRLPYNKKKKKKKKIIAKRSINVLNIKLDLERSLDIIICISIVLEK